MHETELAVRLGRLEAQAENLADEVRDVVVLLNGPPRTDSVRGRLHALEDDRAAAKAASAALEAVRVLNMQTETRTFGRREKLAALTFGSIVAICAIATLALSVAAHL